MGAPTAGDIYLRPGTNSDAVTGLAPLNDTDPYGGPIFSSIAFDGTESGALISPKPITGSDQRFCGALYFSNEASSTGTVANAQVYGRSISQLNASVGQAQLVSDSALDVGVVWIVGKVSGLWVVEAVTLTGTSPVTSANTWDALSVYRWESLSTGLLPTSTFGTVTLSVAGETVGVFRGSINGKATLMATAEFQIALATATNLTIAGTNRLTLATTFVEGDYSRASSWDGDDRALAVPGNELLNGRRIGIAVFQDVPADIPAPKVTWASCYPILRGNPA